MATGPQPEFITASHGTAQHEFVVMERRGSMWGTVGVDAPRETRDAVADDLARLNTMRHATIVTLEAQLFHVTDPDEKAAKAHHLKVVRDSEYAIFERTISPFTRA